VLIYNFSDLITRLFWFVTSFFYHFQGGFFVVLFYVIGLAVGIFVGYNGKVLFQQWTGGVLYVAGFIAIGNDRDTSVVLTALLMGGYVTGLIVHGFLVLF
jgi:hypothetical protein